MSSAGTTGCCAATGSAARLSRIGRLAMRMDLTGSSFEGVSSTCWKQAIERRHELPAIERLGQEAVGAARIRGRGIFAADQQHGDVVKLRGVPDGAAQLTTIETRYHDIADYQVHPARAGQLQGR